LGDRATKQTSTLSRTLSRALNMTVPTVIAGQVKPKRTTVEQPPDHSPPRHDTHRRNRGRAQQRARFPPSCPLPTCRRALLPPPAWAGEGTRESEARHPAIRHPAIRDRCHGSHFFPFLPISSHFFPFLPISSHFFPFLQHNGRYTSPARPSLFTSTESSAQYLCLATDVGTLHLYCPFMSIYVLATDSLLLFIFVAGLARP